MMNYEGRGGGVFIELVFFGCLDVWMLDFEVLRFWGLG